MRIMTWNVHGTFMLNPKFDLDGVCSIIRHWSRVFSESGLSALQEESQVTFDRLPSVPNTAAISP